MKRPALSLIAGLLSPMAAMAQPSSIQPGLGDPCHMTSQALGPGPQSPAQTDVFSFLCQTLNAAQAAANGNPDLAQLQKLYNQGAGMVGVDPQQFGHFQDYFAHPPEGNRYFPPDYDRGSFPYPFLMAPSR